MKALRTLATWRYIAMLIAILGVLVGGTWLTIKTTTEHLLYEHATTSARNWAQYLVANVKDLQQIAAGEVPSTASMAFFKATQNAGTVFQYTIYNQFGYSILISDHSQVTPVELSSYSADALRAAKEHRTVVDAREGGAAGRRTYFAKAYVPVKVDDETVAVVAADVDQTAEHDDFYRSFLITAVVLCLLIGFSFGLPAVAWYRRTREKQQADRRIHYLAHHDALTGLANRVRLIERLDAMLAKLPDSGSIIAVHFIDIDHFKQVNDTLGHDGGDFLLNTIGARLRATSRMEDMVARLGGDEFIVVQTGINAKWQADEYAHRISTALGARVVFNGQEITPNYTIGVALAPADGDTPDRLLKCADLALYEGKKAGRNRVCFFAPEMDEALQNRIALERIVREATEREAFEVHYQPVFEMQGKHLVGFEALARLTAPDGTIIPPAVFIPAAEDMRLIDRLGALVLREACRTATTWPEPLTVAVNLSPVQFESGTLQDIVRETLKETGLAPHRLELEITERLLLGSGKTTMTALTRLKDLGVSIVMDDFGTGYSSLSYLWKFPFDKIKIDRSFMESFERSGHDVETVVKTIIALGRELNMRVTVEGVETPGQVDFLCDANADQVQGFFFGRPVPAAELSADILEDYRRALASVASSDEVSKDKSAATG